MAALYGGVAGNRGEATRLGSRDSGLHTWAQTWGGKVDVYLQHDGECRITVSHPQTGRRIELFDGNIDALVAKETA